MLGGGQRQTSPAGEELVSHSRASEALPCLPWNVTRRVSADAEAELMFSVCQCVWSYQLVA